MEIRTSIKQTTADLLQVLSAFSEEDINKVPFEGSWTAGQLAEHLIRACSPEALFLPTAKTERAPDEMFGAIEKLFLDFSTRFESPEFIRPTGIFHEKKEIMDQLTSHWATIGKAAETLDLNATCIAFEIPGFGHLTLLELIYFMVCHTQRHTHQLKNIYHRLVNHNDHHAVTH